VNARVLVAGRVPFLDLVRSCDEPWYVEALTPT